MLLDLLPAQVEISQVVSSSHKVPEVSAKQNNELSAP